MRWFDGVFICMRDVFVGLSTCLFPFVLVCLFVHLIVRLLIGVFL